MIQKTKKTLALLLALCLLPALIGCGEENTVTAAIPKEDHSVSASSDEQETVPVEYYSDAPDKSETVTVKTAIDGTPEKVTVSVTLARRDENPIQDRTILTDIKNTEGSESYTLLNDGSLVWENKGRNITYEGQTDADLLPVGVHLSFELDGKPLSAKEIEGKSGEVTITVTYDNRSQELLGGFVPFTAMTVLVLGENFYNVDVDNGSVMTISDSTAVLGYALPGLSDALLLTEYEPFKDTELPESVKITAYTTDFELEFSTTAFSNGIFSDMEDEDLKDLDDFYANACDADNGFSQLKGAGGTISSAVGALVSGLESVSKSFAQLSEAISDTSTLAESIYIPDSVYTISPISTEGLSEDVANEINEQIEAANAVIEEYNASRDAWATQIATLQTTLNTISASLSGVSTDTSSASAVSDGVNSYISAVNGVCDSLADELWRYAGIGLLNLKDNLREIRDNDNAYTNFSGCRESQTCEVTFLFESD